MTEKNKEGNKRIARNSILLTIRMVITLLISLYTTRVVLKSLGIEDYGIYNVVCGFVSMFTFLSTSLSNGIQRFFNYEFGKNGIEGAKKVFNTALLIQFILMLIVVLSCETFGLWYLNNHMIIAPERIDAAHWVFHFSMLSFALTIMQVPFSAAIMAHEKMDYFAIVTVLDSVLKLLIAFSIIYLPGDNLFVYGLLMALISVVDFLLYSIYSKLKFKEISLGKFDGLLLKQMLGFSGWNLFGTFSNMLREQGVNVLLNTFFGPIVNAARGVAFQVSGSLQNFVGNLTTAVRPQIVQSYAKGEITRSISLMNSISKLSTLFLVIISYPIAIEIEYILKIWLEGNVPENTGVFMRLVLIVQIFNNLNSCLSALVHATGKLKLYQSVGSIVTLFVLPVCYLWLKLGGSATSVFVICIVFSVLMQSTALLIVKRLLTFSILTYIKEILIPIVKVFLFTFLIPLIPFYLMQESSIRLVLILNISIICMGYASYNICLTKGEKEMVSLMFGKYFKFLKR